jgi:hypothetical protein
LALVAVSQRVPELDQVLVIRLIAMTRGGTPSPVPRRDPRLQTVDPQPSEIILKAPRVSVPPIDESPLGRSADEQRSVSSIGVRKIDHPFSRKIVQITNECLKLGDYTQDVGVAKRPPYLEWAARAIDLAHGCVSLGKCEDCLASRTNPPLEGNRTRARHRHPTLRGNSPRRELRVPFDP